MCLDSYGMLQLVVILICDAAECTSIEASSRAVHPVHGRAGIISQLQQHQTIDAQSELVSYSSLQLTAASANTRK
ncbi:hypothetical protein OIU77_012996 [Salix suchowensis]|uniref:Secreted protein n=1 Tax=Salix suchowensis TaxID=1278906 RepID=A0ABQ9A7X3_9ROSI|nr:hypothetical protein OIU77_012996 [Salix suchowensis]